MVALVGEHSSQFIENLIKKEKQIQPAGVELTVRKVYLYGDVGELGFEHRKLPKYLELPFVGEDDYGKYWYLHYGCYKIQFNEIIKVPKWCIGICLPRSSLIRMGATLCTALWDPGYVGRSEVMLVVFNPHGIKLYENAKIAQIVFIKLEKPVEKGYQGIYQYEGLK